MEQNPICRSYRSKDYIAEFSARQQHLHGKRESHLLIQSSTLPSHQWKNKDRYLHRR